MKLDPEAILKIAHCSSRAQVKRVAKSRGMDEDEAIKYWEELESAWAVPPDDLKSTLQPKKGKEG